MRLLRRHRSTMAVTVVALVAVGCASTSTENTGSSGSPSPNTATAEPSETAGALSPPQVAGVAIPDGQIDDAVAQVGDLARGLMDSSGIPGMAVAVVHGGETVFAEGFGVRREGSDEPIDPQTVFQLASMSKPIGSTVVAHQVDEGVVSWDTPVVEHLPSFTLADPYVGSHVTVGDLYSHRSGLPEHAGDDLEDIGYDRAEVIERLRYLPLGPYRITYDYTNFGLTAAAESVAVASGQDWADLSEQVLYEPLGMTSTSSRFADFAAQENRAPGHILVDGEYVARDVRMPDEQSPAGGISSSVEDVAKWLTMLLADGEYEGGRIASPAALQAAFTPQSTSSPPETPDSRAGSYGYGFNVGTSPAGRVTLSHSGAFASGAATAFTAIPSADVAIVVLTNAAPIGVPETLAAEFADLVQFGEVREDWSDLYTGAFSSFADPVGSLAGQSPPADPEPPKPLADYTGVYDNEYFGPARIEENDGELALVIGPDDRTYPLTHWDGDVFTFPLSNENAPDGTISKAVFTPDDVTFEYWDTNGLGTFRKGDA